MHTIVKSVTEKVKLSQMSMGQKLLYGGILVAGLAVAAPVIALAVAGVTSLFKLVVVGVSLFALLLLLPVGHVTALIALVIHLFGVFASRWLFFAEAEHVVGLYYSRG